MASRAEVWEDADGDIYVKCPYDEDWNTQAKMMRGRWDPEEKAWVFYSDMNSLDEVMSEVRLFFPG